MSIILIIREINNRPSSIINRGPRRNGVTHIQLPLSLSLLLSPLSPISLMVELRSGRQITAMEGTSSLVEARVDTSRDRVFV